MKFQRSSGIILHPSSLPGPDGIGDLGPAAFNWIRFLSETGCGLWQVLPLGPTGFGDSPYQSLSAFAGNPNLISPALLVEDRLLDNSDLEDRPIFTENRVEFSKVIEWKRILLHRAFERFCNNGQRELKSELQFFIEREANWLLEYSVYAAIKDTHHGNSWNLWPPPLKMHDEQTIAEYRNMHQVEILWQQFVQFLFFRQWHSLKDFAINNGIKIIGDIPIFVSYDSSDVWSNPHLFDLDPDCRPRVVAGVPPDYFSSTGQLWGNPLYKWEEHKKTGYSWWISRLQQVLTMVDIIRLDHFRGFAGYWEVPAGMTTAEKGQWVTGPGEDFFNTVINRLGDLPIIAEDLGEITPDVIELMHHFSFPGMKVLQFAFSSDPNNPFLPHNYPVDCVAYTGTHDNDTAYGWYKTANRNEKEFFKAYTGSTGHDVPWDMIRAVWSSIAKLALAPLQDLLEKDSKARMNFPSTQTGNWSWRAVNGEITAQLADRLRKMNYLYSRCTIN